MTKLYVLRNIQLAVDSAVKKNENIPIFHNLMPIVYSEEVLLLAQNNLQNNKGALTPGMTDNTVDGSSLKRLLEIQTKLKNNTYQFPTVRRTYLPKPGKNIKWTKKNLISSGRPLGMPDFDAKIVQEALRLVLDAIYEPLFEKTNTNYGFRTQKGAHDAFLKLKEQAKGLDTAIEGDIKGAFPSLDHEIIISLLSKRITDQKFLNLIYKACKSGIFDTLAEKNIDPLVGVPQGGIVSPILWNIYMHEFDKFILNDIKDLFDCLNKRQNRQDRPPNKLYIKYAQRRKLITQKLNCYFKAEDIKKLQLEKTTLTKKINKMKSADESLITLRFHYIRYADDWYLMTNGSKALNIYLKNKIASFLYYHLKLILSPEKTKITNILKNRVKFLGFSIFKPKTSRIIINKSGNPQRTTNSEPEIGIDKDRVLNRLRDRGYIDFKHFPREQPALSILSDYEIISRYNSIIRGYANYYLPMIDRRISINYFIYLLEYSCYKTLAQKHKTSVRKIIRNKGITKTNETNNLSEVTLLTVKNYYSRIKDTIQNIKKNLTTKNRNQSLIADGSSL